MKEAMEFGVQLLGLGIAFGFAGSVLVVMATSAVCAVVHTLKSVMSGGR